MSALDKLIMMFVENERDDSGRMSPIVYDEVIEPAEKELASLRAENEKLQAKNIHYAGMIDGLLAKLAAADKLADDAGYALGEGVAWKANLRVALAAYRKAGE